MNKCNSHGCTALYLAAKKGEADLVKPLIAAGSNINYTCKEEGGYTPLIVAATNEHKAVVSLLTKVRVGSKMPSSMQICCLAPSKLD